MAKKSKKAKSDVVAEKREKERLKKARQRAKKRGEDPDSVREQDKQKKAKKRVNARQQAIKETKKAIERASITPINPDKIARAPLNQRELLLSMIQYCQAVIQTQADDFIDDKGREIGFSKLSLHAKAACTVERDNTGLMQYRPPSHKDKENSIKILGQILSLSGTLADLIENEQEENNVIISIQPVDVSQKEN